jgi:hypothetical protein
MTIDLSGEMQERLASAGITQYDEVALRQILEQHTTTYTLIKLAAWPARRWKCHYRLMLRDDMFDAQNVSEAYAMGILNFVQATAGKESQPGEEQ